MNVDLDPRLPLASSARGSARSHRDFLRPGCFYITERSEGSAFSSSGASVPGVRPDPVEASKSNRIVERTHPLPTFARFPREAFRSSSLTHPTPQLPCPLGSSLIKSSTNIDSKQLAKKVTPLDATFTKNRGRGASYC